MKKRINIIAGCFECSRYIRKMGLCELKQRKVEFQNDECTGFPEWCPLEEQQSKNTIFSGENSRQMWKEINELRETLPQAWEALYTIGCKLQELEWEVDKLGINH